MGFDMSGVQQQAKNFSERREPGDFKYKLLYPGVGKTTVKLLFNPKSNSIARLINRHEIDDSKIPCLRTWGDKCPICGVLSDIKNATGQDLTRNKSRARGISFAQLIETTVVPTRDNSPLPGDIILFMYPYTVYKGILDALSDFKTEEDLQGLIGSNESLAFVISRSPDNTYSTRILPGQKYRTCNSQEEFEELLNNMDSLNDQVLPAMCNGDIETQAHDAAMDLKARYLSGNTAPRSSNGYMNTQASTMSYGASSFQPQTYSPAPAPSQPMMPTNPQPQGFSQPQMGNPGMPVQNPAPQQPAPTVQSFQTAPDTDIPFDSGAAAATAGDSVPDCFGKYDPATVAPEKCMMCPSEFSCKGEL